MAVLYHHAQGRCCNICVPGFHSYTIRGGLISHPRTGDAPHHALTSAVRAAHVAKPDGGIRTHLPPESLHHDFHLAFAALAVVAEVEQATAQRLGLDVNVGHVCGLELEEHPTTLLDSPRSASAPLCASHVLNYCRCPTCSGHRRDVRSVLGPKSS